MASATTPPAAQSRRSKAKKPVPRMTIVGVPSADRASATASTLMATANPALPTVHAERATPDMLGPWRARELSALARTVTL
jgi:hypothetical protein